MDGLLVLLLLLAQTVGSLKLTPAGVDSGSLVCTTCVCTGGLVDVRGQQAGEPAYGVMGTYHLYDDGSDAPNGRPTFVLRDSFFLFFASADAGETGWAIGPVLQGQPYVLFARSDVATSSASAGSLARTLRAVSSTASGTRPSTAATVHMNE